MMRQVLIAICGLILLAGEVSASTRLSFTNFETGTAEGWTLTSPGAAISTARPYSGTHSVRVENWYGGDKVFRNFGEVVNLPQVVVRWKWYTQSWDSGKGVKFFRLRGTDLNDNPYVEGFVNQDSNPLYYFWGVFRNTDQVLSPFNGGGACWTGMGQGTWTDIMVLIVYNTPGQSDGILRVWFNEALTYNYTDKNWRGSTSEWGDFIVVTGNPGTGSEMTNSIHYVDDIEIWDGLPDTEPTPTPTPTPSPTPAPTPTPTPTPEPTPTPTPPVVTGYGAKYFRP